MSVIPHELDEVNDSPEQREHFRVNDDGAAAWAMERLAEVRKQMAAHQELRDKGVQRLDVWLEQVQKPLLNNASFFEHLLHDYARRQRHALDRKSIVLPHGKVSTRVVQPKLTIDTDVFVIWAKQNRPDFIRTVEEADIKQMRAAVVINDSVVIDPDSGEIVQGVTASNEELSISIKLTEEETQ